MVKMISFSSTPKKYHFVFTDQMDAFNELHVGLGPVVRQPVGYTGPPPICNFIIICYFIRDKITVT